MKKIITTVALLSLFATPVLAAEFVAPSSQDGAVTIRQDEVRKNLYTAGQNVSVNGKVEGDLFAAGNLLNVSGEVTEDIMAAGNTVNLNGKMGGDVRAAGGSVSISQSIAGDALLAGGNIFIGQGVEVKGDLLAAGGILSIDGAVRGKATLAGGVITINGAIDGPLEVWADDTLVFGKNAQVVGPIRYHGRHEAEIQEGATVGQIEFTKVEKRDPRWEYLGAKILSGLVLLKFLAMLLAGLVLAAVAKKRLARVTDDVTQKPWLSLGIGFVAVVVIPIALLIALVTIVGFYLGLMVGAWFLFALALGGLAQAILVGRWILRQLKVETPGGEISWREVLTGTLAITILCLIPIFGWLVCLVTYLMAFGGLIRMVEREILELRS